jgi:hypothetical protein
MRNIDQEREERYSRVDRDFVLGGQQFTVRPSCKQRVWADYWDGLIEKTTTLTNHQYLDWLLGFLVDHLLEPEDGDRFRRLVDEYDDPPIMAADVSAVIDFAWAAHTGRPPTQPEPSSHGPEPTGASSTPGSPSQEDQS